MSKWILDELAAAYRHRGVLVLLFDYDGTLAPIAPLPRLARLSGRMRLILQRLTRRPGVTLGILSGRAVDELKDMVCLDNVCLAGVSGLELELSGRRIVHRQAAQAAGIIAALNRSLQREFVNLTGPGSRTKDSA